MQPVPATTPTPRKSDEPRCPCGYDKDHYMVTPSPTHGLGGWLRVLIGISTRPQKITYRCRRCDNVITETTDPDALDRFY